jgi:hypothetical protein
MGRYIFAVEPIWEENGGTRRDFIRRGKEKRRNIKWVRTIISDAHGGIQVVVKTEWLDTVW